MGDWTPGPWRRKSPHRRTEMAVLMTEDGSFIGEFARREDADLAGVAPEMAEALRVVELEFSGEYAIHVLGELLTDAQVAALDDVRALLAKVNGESDG